MNIEWKLAELFELILQEMKSNKSFAEKIEGIFKDNGQGTDKKTRSSTRKNTGLAGAGAVKDASGNASVSTSRTRSRKRNPALFNPETVLEERGKEALLVALNQLEVDQLKDIVSEFGMDPAKKVMKWRTKEKIVIHILEVTNNRVRKGEAFRRIHL